PRRAAVLAAEQHTGVALEIGAGRHPDRPRITGDLTDVAAVGLVLVVQRLQARARPVPALVRAAEQAGASDGQHGARPPPPDDHAVHVHGVVVHVLAVAHVLPVLAAVQTADDAADLDGAIDLVGVGGIRRQLQYALGRIGSGRHAHLRKAHG